MNDLQFLYHKKDKCETCKWYYVWEYRKNKIMILCRHPKVIQIYFKLQLTSPIFKQLTENCIRLEGYERFAG